MRLGVKVIKLPFFWLSCTSLAAECEDCCFGVGISSKDFRFLMLRLSLLVVLVACEPVPYPPPSPIKSKSYFKTGSVCPVRALDLGEVLGDAIFRCFADVTDVWCLDMSL